MAYTELVSCPKCGKTVRPKNGKIEPHKVTRYNFNGNNKKPDFFWCNGKK